MRIIIEVTVILISLAKNWTADTLEDFTVNNQLENSENNQLIDQTVSV